MTDAQTGAGPPEDTALADAIRLRVILRDIAAGAIVEESVVADALRVSRTPVREALSELAGEGLLQYERNRGYRTPLFALQDMRDFFDTAGAVYPVVFAAAARKRSPEDIARMAGHLDALGGLARLEDYRERVSRYRAFMLGIARATRNRFHLPVMRGLVDAHVMLRVDFASAADAATRESEMHRNLAVYQEIFDAIESGDGDHAATLARRRLDASRAFITDEILGL